MGVTAGIVWVPTGWLNNFGTSVFVLRTFTVRLCKITNQSLNQRINQSQSSDTIHLILISSPTNSTHRCDQSAERSWQTPQKCRKYSNFQTLPSISDCFSGRFRPYTNIRALVDLSPAENGPNLGKFPLDFANFPTPMDSANSLSTFLVGSPSRSARNSVKI